MFSLPFLKINLNMLKYEVKTSNLSYIIEEKKLF